VRPIAKGIPDSL